MPPSFGIEKEYAGPVAGVDEAGRGPLAGPVVAAAVILNRKSCPRGIDDSKKLNVQVRERLYTKLIRCARFGIGIASVEEIDRLNIFWATLLAMQRAVEALGVEPGTVLVDGNRCPNWRYPSRAIIGGDGKCRSIAPASILAKVTRDRMMTEYCAAHPGYGWTNNKGYGTPEHHEALGRIGLSPLHRRSFAPVRHYLNRGESGAFTQPQHMLDL